MKWFKHLSGSGDDQLIMDSISLFGTDAYYFYFRILEIMSDEFDVKNPGVNTFLLKTLRKKLQISVKKMKKIAKFFHEKERIFYSENLTPRNPSVTFNCPKLKELCDEYTSKQLSKMSGVTPDSNREFVGTSYNRKQIRDNISLSSYTNTSNNKPSTNISNNVYSDKQPLAASSDEKKSNHFSEKISKDLVEKIDEICKQIKTNKTLQEKKFNGWKFAQKNCTAHPQAILHVLEQVKKQGDVIKSPWAYANKVLHIESQNYNEHETVQAHKLMKRLFADMFSTTIRGG